MNLENRVALVTGGSLGIGRAAAAALASDGATVIICGRNSDRLKSAADQITGSSGATVEGIAADCGLDGDVSRLVNTMIRRFGRIDILVNSLQGPKAVSFIDSTDQDWLDAFNTKLMGQIRCARHAFPHMMRNRWGRIINITSVVGQAGSPGQANYAASKAGLIGMTKSLAQEVASRNITVNAVAPGYIATDMTKDLSDELKQSIMAKIPLARMGTPEDVAAAVKFLAGDEASYITGQVIAVNGGMYM